MTHRAGKDPTGQLLAGTSLGAAAAVGLVHLVVTTAVAFAIVALTRRSVVKRRP